MGKRSRTKGHAFERKIANALKAIGINARRGYQSWRDDPLGAFEGKEPDVVCGDPLEALWIECKVGARPNVWAAMDQACRDASKGRTPIVIAHRDRGRTLVCVELEDALEFVREGMGEDDESQST